jgi:hypothetical protein
MGTIAISRGFRNGVAALGLMAAASIPLAQAQVAAPPDQDGAPAAKAKTAKKAAGGPTIFGKWSGQLTQVGNEKTPLKIELSITGRGAETKYPDIQCTGKLTRAGSSKTYVFFVEIIATGRADKGGRCPDGTITVARQGDNLVLDWFGSIENNLIVNYGTLSKAQ